MDLYQFLTKNSKQDIAELSTQARYQTAIQLMGGPDAFLSYIPFDLPTLQASYAKDPHFNTDLTPINRWDAATGVHIVNGQSTRRPVATGKGLWPLLHAYGITAIALSQGVCLLKYAAEMLVTENPCPHEETCFAGFKLDYQNPADKNDHTLHTLGKCKACGKEIPIRQPEIIKHHGETYNGIDTAYLHTHQVWKHIGQPLPSEVKDFDELFVQMFREDDWPVIQNWLKTSLQPPKQ